MDSLLDPTGFKIRSQFNHLTKTSNSDGHDPIRDKAEELEGVFLNTLVSQMFSSLDAEGTFGGGHAEETWRSMQAEQYADLIAKNGGVGLADQIMSQLLAAQESSQALAPTTPQSQGANLK